MSQVTGYVKEIYEGTTKTGRSAGDKFWSITLDANQKLTTFNGNYIDGVEIGKEYTFTYETDGKYANLSAPTVPCIRNDSETTSPDSVTAPQPLELPHEVARGLAKELDKKIVGTDAPAGIPLRILGTASNKDEAIRKAVALKAAVEYVASVLGGTGTTKDVISYAREFEEYLK